MGGLISGLGNLITGGGSPSGTISGANTAGSLGNIAQAAYAAPITSLAGRTAGYAPTVSGYGADVANIAPQVGQLAGQEAQYANIPLAGGQQQYQAGLAGQLTPAQQALTDYTLGQMNTSTAGRYGQLGLGDSTMQSQDLASNQLRSLGQQEDIAFQNEQMGLNALGLGSNMLQGAGGLYGQEGSLYGTAGNLDTQAANINRIAGSLYGTAAGEIGSAASGFSNKANQLASLLSGGGGGLGGLAGSDPLAQGGAVKSLLDPTGTASAGGWTDVGSGAVGGSNALGGTISDFTGTTGAGTDLASLGTDLLTTLGLA